jgi:CBS-domain-containing membrane protein
MHAGMQSSIHPALVAATTKSELEFWAVVSQLTISDLFPTVIVPVTLDRRCSVGDALQKMREHNIRALPIVDYVTKEDFIGMVDVADISSFIASDYKEVNGDGKNQGLLERNVLEIMNKSRRDPLVPYFKGSPLGALIQLMASGVHRCPLVDERGNFVSIISQSDLLGFMWSHRAHWHQLGATPCKELHGILGQVKTVHESYVALDCFRKLNDEQVSALAIVQDGILVATFSATDVLRLRKENFALLNEPVSKLLHTEEAWPVTLDDTATLVDATKVLLEEQLHRVWLLGTAGVPVGLVSTTDVCSQFLTLLSDL